MCHLKISYEDTERTREALRIWARFYKELEQKAKGMTKDPAIVAIPISETEAFTVLLTGRDAFLGVYSHDTKDISQECNFEKIIYMRTGALDKLLQYISNMEKNLEIPHYHNLASLWGRQIVKIRAAESIFNQTPEELAKLAKAQVNLKKLENAYLPLMPKRENKRDTWNI